MMEPVSNVGNGWHSLLQDRGDNSGGLDFRKKMGGDISIFLGNFNQKAPGLNEGANAVIG